MTGYGRGSATLGRGSVVVEARAVNHRFLDLRMRVAPELATEGALVEDLVRKHALRGRVDVSVRIEGALGGEPILDVTRARTALAALRTLRDEVAPSDPIPLSLLASVPSLFREGGLPDAAERERATTTAAQAALAELARMRRNEGAALAHDLGARIDRITTLLDTIEPELARVVPALRDKLTARIERLLEGGAARLDAHRLELEVAVLADRADVSEEITRLRSHARQLRLALASTEDALGRKLEFLMQEMGREANTAGSKVPDPGLTHLLLEVKAELERMREQVQNVL